MTIRNLNIFATFDPQAAGFSSQTQLVAAAIEQQLRADSGVTDLTARPIGAAKVKGGSLGAQNVLVDIPTTGDVDEDNLRGTMVAFSVQGGPFLSGVAAILTTASGFPSSLLDASPSLGNALSNSPPGLIVTLPNPDLELVLVVTPPFFAAYEIYLRNSPLAIGAQVSQPFAITINTSVATAPGGVFGYRQDLTAPGQQSSPGTGNHLGLWKSVITNIFNGFPYSNTVDALLATTAMTKAGTPIGSQSGTFPPVPRNFFQLNASRIATPGRFQMAGHALGTTIMSRSYTENGVPIGLGTNFTGELTFKNNTLAPIAVDTKVAGLRAVALVITEL